MVSKKKVKSKNGVRFDSKHIRLRTGESEKDNGTYVYRWTDKVGKRHAVYAPTLADLREQEEQIIVDRHDGIKTNVKNITVNDLFDLWVQVKRGVKDSTMKNYIYMYEMFVKPTFGKKKLTQVKKVAMVGHLLPNIFEHQPTTGDGFCKEYATEVIRIMEEEDVDAIIPGETIDWTVMFKYIRQ